MNLRFLSLLLLFALAAAVVARAEAPAPEYLPLCASPQAVAPLMPAGGAQVKSKSPAVWNGKEYATAWVDYWAVKFRRFFADGTPDGPVVTVFAGQVYDTVPAAFVWNGSGYAVAYCAWSGSTYQVYFLRLDAAGSPIGTPLKVSFVGSTETASAMSPALAWSGAGYVVVWQDSRNGNSDLFGTFLDSSGAIAVSGAYHDLYLQYASDTQGNPAVVWSSGAGAYQLVWNDYRSGTHFEIWGNQMTPPPMTGSAPVNLVSGIGSSTLPALADNGSGVGMAFIDTRDGNQEIYFARLALSGQKIGTETRLTNSPNNSVQPTLAWTGSEYGVAFCDDRSGAWESWFQRVTVTGAASGSNLQIIQTGDGRTPGLAFAKFGYLFTADAYGYGNYVQSLGCAADATPPSCPVNLVAYNITGTTATVAWVPSVEDATDLAYYEVYRNSALVGRTAETYYADTGLSLSTTYNYYVRPVNAAQLVNGSCTASLYVKTNATLTLKLDKSQDDAALSWTDIALNNYNVFRGTDPRVMQQIGSSTGQSYTDANVLTDAVLYFYTVDEPGQ